MSQAPAFWRQIAARYQALTLRERRVVALLAILGPALLLYTLVLDPAFKRQQALKASLASGTQQIVDLKRQTAVIDEQLRLDPDADSKAQLARLREALGGADGRLKKLEDSMIPPNQMNATLERILARIPNLQLVSLKTLPPESVLAPPKTDAKEAGDGQKPAIARPFDLYRHGIEIRLEGSYADLHAYVSHLEHEQKKLLWGRLQFEVKKHPTIGMTLLIYTLSSDKAWLSI